MQGGTHINKKRADRGFSELEIGLLINTAYIEACRRDAFLRYSHGLMDEDFFFLI